MARSRYRLNEEGRKELARAGKTQEGFFNEFIKPRLGAEYWNSFRDLSSRGLSDATCLQLINAINESNIPVKLTGKTIRIDLKSHVEEIPSRKTSGRKSETNAFQLKDNSQSTPTRQEEYAKQFRPNLAIIKAQLQHRNWARGDLARHSGCSITTIDSILAGGEAYLQTLEKIASAINVRVDEVVLGCTKDSAAPPIETTVYNRRAIKVSITVEGDFDSVSDPQLKALLKCFAAELGSDVAPLALHGTRSGSIVVLTRMNIDEAAAAVISLQEGRLDGLRVVCIEFLAKQKDLSALLQRIQRGRTGTGGFVGIILRRHFARFSPSAWLASINTCELPRIEQRFTNSLSGFRNWCSDMIDLALDTSGVPSAVRFLAVWLALCALLFNALVFAIDTNIAHKIISPSGLALLTSTYVKSFALMICMPRAILLGQDLLLLVVIGVMTIARSALRPFICIPDSFIGRLEYRRVR